MFALCAHPGPYLAPFIRAGDKYANPRALTHFSLASDITANIDMDPAKYGDGISLFNTNVDRHAPSNSQEHIDAGCERFASSDQYPHAHVRRRTDGPDSGRGIRHGKRE